MAALLSNWFVSFLNFCSLLLGLAAISYTVYLLVHGGSGSPCQKSIHVPLLIIIDAYLVVISLLIVGCVIFSGFAIFASREDPSSGNYELKINYSTWLEKHFVNEKNWNKIRSCLIDANIFENENATVALPEIGGADMLGGDDTDCYRWSNDKGRRCYNCKSCKAGVVKQTKKKWRFVVIADVCVVVLLILFGAACYSKNNSNGSPKQDHKPMDTETPLHTN
ncbi:hypothetical protein ACOSQ4_026307 [Xanthoceras sorbifolium]